MDTRRLYQLLNRYASRATTPAEEQELFSLIEDGDEQALKDQLGQILQATGSDPDPDGVRWQPLLDRILSNARMIEAEPMPGIRRRLPWARMAAAAVILLVLGAGGWYWGQRARNGQTARERPVQKTRDIAPGGHHATLTLDGGGTILLDSASNGELASQGSSRIVKLNDGRLVYQPADAGTGLLVYNMVTIPRGGFYQLGLPDGTQVWLNAASSLRFPTAFKGDTREVEMTGEAYFEVAADKAHPFIVHTRGTRVTVLGTHFNINAYDDEPALRTTLLQGSVKFTGDESPVREILLSPGQQSIFDPIGKKISLRAADTAAVVAWKNGQLTLKGIDMAALMRQIARWYDVNVQFEGVVPDEKFGGSLSRNVNLSVVLEALQENGVQCRLAGNTIRILKQN